MPLWEFLMRMAHWFVSSMKGWISKPFHASLTFPRGYGLLEVIQRERRTLRFRDMQTDPRRIGFPTGHPMMHSLLGVPIMRGDQLPRANLPGRQIISL